MDQQLDTAIDQVAREMTAAELPSALRAEVLARIERERAGRTGRTGGLFLPRWAWVGAAAVVLAGVGATLWVARPEPAADRTAFVSPAAPRPAQTDRATAPAATLVADMTAPSSPPAPRPGPARPAAEPQRVGLPDDAGPAPLEGPSALDIAPLGPAAIAIPDLGVTALDAIEPLTVSTIGPGSPEPQRRDRE